MILYIRMMPSWLFPIVLKVDFALHYRLFEEALRHSLTGWTDHLAEYPAGRRIDQYLPLGLYTIPAGIYGMLKEWIIQTPQHFIFWFCGIITSLSFPACYKILRTLHLNHRMSLAGGFCASLWPVFLERTFCYNYRGEAIAISALLFASFFFLAFIKSSRWLYLVGSLLCIGLAASVWRVAVLYPILYALVCGILIIQTHHAKRALLIAIAILLTTAAFTLGTGKHVYGSSILHAALYHLHIGKALDTHSAIFFTVQELKPLLASLHYVHCRHFLLFSVGALGLGLWAFLPKATRGLWKNEHLAFYLLTFLFGILAILFVRNLILASPFIMMAIFVSLGILHQSPNKKRRMALTLLTTTLVIGIFANAIQLTLKTGPNILYSDQLRQSLEFIKNKIPEDAVVLSNWSFEYDIQTYSNKRTVIDGLLESQVNVDRIIELGAAYAEEGEEKLIAFCKKYGITHIFLARQYAGYFDFVAHPNRDPKTIGEYDPHSILSVFVARPYDLVHFKDVFSTAYYSVFEVL